MGDAPIQDKVIENLETLLDPPHIISIFLLLIMFELALRTL